MTDPILLLVAGVLIGVVVIVYWRVIAAILAVATVAVFVVGIATVAQAVQHLTP